MTGCRESVYGHRGAIQSATDIVIFVNGLPLAVIELKKRGMRAPTSGTRSISSRPTNCKISSLFNYNVVLVISDGLEARIRDNQRRPGTVHAVADRITGETIAPPSMPQLEVMLRGVFEKRRFLDLVRAFHRVRDRPDIGRGHQRRCPVITSSMP